jgi:putative flippase GtrA
MTMRLRHQALRFLIAGAVNTAVTYAIYLGLLPFLSYALAYTIAYVCGIVIAYWLNTAFVFRVSRTLAGMASFPLVYLVQYLLGILILGIAVRTFDIPRQAALLASIVVTIPVTFVFSRWLLHRGSQKIEP